MAAPEETAGIRSSEFDKTIEGKQVQLFTLRNSHGLVCQITNYGARVVSLYTPDRNGDLTDIVLGYPSLEGYVNSPEMYFGATIGRFSNRIAKGRFKLGDKEYQLACNDGANHIHGGNKGFNRKVWEVGSISEAELELNYLAVDGEEGYPGNLHVKVVYTLNEENELQISYTATTDQATPINLTNHSYFNLKGAGEGLITDHVLWINADHYTPLGKGLIPNGNIDSVANTPFDFRKPIPISKRIDLKDDQIKMGSGFDHNFITNGKGLRLAARMEEPKSGRTMEVLTTEPGMQFYSGNFLDGSVIGKKERTYPFRSAFCFETQQFPDNLNQAHFPKSILHVGETWRSTTIYRLGIS